MLELKSTVNWKEIVELFNRIKYLYSLCEETDPELSTNIQPLNEFRAALDHMMRIVAIENFDECKNKSAEDEAKKLLSHLRRAFFDVCDMLAINYRNRIISILEPYDSSIIRKCIPHYYDTIKPDISAISEEIASLRTDKRVNSEEENTLDRYVEIIEKLKKYHQTVVNSESSLVELEMEKMEIQKKATKRDLINSRVIPIASIIIGAIIAIWGSLN